MKPENTDTPLKADCNPRLVLLLPNSVGWWWCKSKDGDLPGDELCVEVSEVWSGGAIVHFGRDHDMIRPADHDEGITEWFYDMEWVKASSPWQNEKSPDAGATE